MNDVTPVNPHQRPSKPTQNWRLDEFRKSSFSEAQENSCVEVAMRPGVVAVRNSNHIWGEGPITEFTPDEWRAHIKGVKAGEFDLA